MVTDVAGIVVAAMRGPPCFLRVTYADQPRDDLQSDTSCDAGRLQGKDKLRGSESSLVVFVSW